MLDQLANLITPGVGQFLSGGLGFLGQMDTNAQNEANTASANEFNAKQAQMNRDYQTEMSNSAYQRQVTDMSAAGLNPMLAYMKGGGASSPSGSTASATVPQYTSPIQGAAQYKLTTAQTAKTETETTNVSKLSDRIDQDISNMKTDQEKTKAVIDNLRVERDNLIKQGFNLTEVGNQLRASVINLQAQSRQFNALTSSTDFQAMINNYEQQLRKMDVEASQGVGNFGREYNQVKPIIDLLRSFIRR